MARVLGAPGLVRHEVTRAELWLTAPGAWRVPADVTGASVPAVVPGTVAAALQAAGQWAPDDARDLDAEDAWFRTRLVVPAGPGALRLRFDGVATGAEIWVDGAPQPPATSALRSHVIELPPTLRGEVELVFVCRALATTLGQKWPRPRWKTRLVRNQNLRFVRTPLVGRMPAFSPGPAPVGPLRPIVVERVGAIDVRRCSLQATVTPASVGEVAVVIEVAAPLARPPTLRVGDATQPLQLAADGRTARGTLRLDHPARWWPHTHGAPARYPVVVVTDAGPIDLGMVGFRALAWPAPEAPFVINGRPVFLRGAAWLPIDPVRMFADEDALRAALQQFRDAGGNMLRVPGTGMYEADAFYALCDELGILVWQEALLANLDYPTDAAFADELRAELDAVLDRLEAAPCLAVLCGGSEVEQQATMWGHPPAELAWPLLDDVVRPTAHAARADVPFVRNSPTGGALPFHVGQGVAHYYGVGAYRRPLEDARRAQVRFASECLAFANVGDHDALAAGVPRDVGAAWDFADVRDHYLALRYRVDPAALRGTDPARYAALSRVVSGDVMAATFGEWRSGACTRGALVWHWRDVQPGSGWGVVDAAGRPKAAYWYLRRAWAPIALWASDEGQDGVWLHVTYDREPAPEDQPVLEVRVLRDGALELARGHQHIAGSSRIAVDAMLGRFMDSAYAYRFGPPGHDALVATLTAADGTLLADTVYFPLGPPAEVHADLGLTAELIAGGLRLTTRRLAHAVAISAPGCDLAANYVDVYPGVARFVGLRGTLAGPLRLAPLNGPALQVP